MNCLLAIGPRSLALYIFQLAALLLSNSISCVSFAWCLTIRLPARITRTLIALMLGMLSERMRFG